MVYSTLANMDFQNILFEAQANTQTGEQLLNKYKSFLLANEVTCGLVNGFVQEAKSCLYDSGVKYVLECVSDVINDNKISWQLATACESINRNNKSYNYLNRNAAQQVEKLLEMEETDVVKYIKAGALKNVMFCESFRNIAKQCYGEGCIVETYADFTSVHPLSIVESIGSVNFFEVNGKLFKIDEGQISEGNWNEVSHEFQMITSLLESKLVKFDNDTLFVNFRDVEYQITESNKVVRLTMDDEKELTNEQLRELNKLTVSTVSPRHAHQVASVLESIALVCENFDNLAILDNANIITTANDKFIVIESEGTIYAESIASTRPGKWSINESVIEAIDYIKRQTKTNISEMFTESIEKEYNNRCTEEKEEIKENLKNDQIQERREKIAMLTERFKNDPVKLAILSQLAEDLNNI